MRKKFNSRLIVVAGGTGALGQAIASAFVSEGARVVVTSRNARTPAASKGQEAAPITYRVDLADAQSVNAFIADVRAQLGEIDVLVNTVGGYAGGAPVWEAPSDELARMLAVNLQVAHALARAVIPSMLEQGHGALVNVAARAALRPPARAAAYAASKAAVLALFSSLAEEVSGSPLRINSILPNIIDTPENRRAMPDADFSEWSAPEDIARVVTFLYSDASRAVHGAAIPV